MPTPHASSPQTALADVEQRIVAAAREREESAAESGSQGSPSGRHVSARSVQR